MPSRKCFTGWQFLLAIVCFFGLIYFPVKSHALGWKRQYFVNVPGGRLGQSEDLDVRLSVRVLRQALSPALHAPESESNPVVLTLEYQEGTVESETSDDTYVGALTGSLPERSFLAEATQQEDFRLVALVKSLSNSAVFEVFARHAAQLARTKPQNLLEATVLNESDVKIERKEACVEISLPEREAVSLREKRENEFGVQLKPLNDRSDPAPPSGINIVDTSRWPAPLANYPYGKGTSLVTTTFTFVSKVDISDTEEQELSELSVETTLWMLVDSSSIPQVMILTTVENDFEFFSAISYGASTNTDPVTIRPQAATGLATEAPSPQLVPVSYGSNSGIE
ncbi:hypothetical protein M3P05_13485 [Sansalvadorimonas sp. 2012CJ34-2]|uniref:Transmembrane protein n=1 Tax=Parendozoicomonas callyspongiae TaxID=2942213 RepID=A0ABT0PJM1_9GAMM|nr:hypothetical protein [Sansalvadorimonas sp. 2012CJ34-2]MCL6270937.1 hypothetical protein [Sansalvadorimonas sp. 2012CJ34-2]